MPRPRLVGGVVDRAWLPPTPREGADISASAVWDHESMAKGAGERCESNSIFLGECRVMDG
jgi:hypothetical protein